MRKLALGVAALTLATASAFAQTPVTFEQVDSDGDGRLSYEELLVVWPDLTAEEFAAADVEGAGGVTAEQLTTLQPTAAPAAPADAVPAPAETLPAEPVPPGAVEPVPMAPAVPAPSDPTTDLTAPPESDDGGAESLSPTN